MYLVSEAPYYRQSLACAPASSWARTSAVSKTALRSLQITPQIVHGSKSASQVVKTSTSAHVLFLFGLSGLAKQGSAARKLINPILQLLLFMVAIHATTDLVSHFMTDITYYPEILGPLEKEILAVRGQEAWTKSALSKMQLLDSTIKESQRVKPIQISKFMEGVSISTQQQITDMFPISHDAPLYSRRLHPP